MPNKFKLPEPIQYQRTEPKDPKKTINVQPELRTVDKNGVPQKTKGMIASQRVRTESMKIEGILFSVYADALNEWTEDLGKDMNEFANKKVAEYIAETRCSKAKSKWSKAAKAMGQEKK